MDSYRPYYVFFFISMTLLFGFLFVDDCVLKYRIIKSDQDQQYLQSDLDLILNWSKSWQTWFNVNKCVTLRCNRSLHPRSLIYYLNRQPLNCVTEHSYLDTLVTSSMSFSSHVNNMITKAAKILNFI